MRLFNILITYLYNNLGIGKLTIYYIVYLTILISYRGATLSRTRPILLKF